MGLKIRKYRDEDFDTVLKLCNESYLFDDLSAQLLNEKIYQDPFYDENLIWVSLWDNEIVGFLMGVCRFNIAGVNYGYVKMMAVNENYRRQGIATGMYRLLESELIDRQVDVVRFGDVPMNYFMPGIDPRYTPALCFVMRNGFIRFTDTSNLKVSLNSRDWSDNEREEGLRNQGVVVARATADDKSALMDFVASEWKLWQYELEMAYKQKPIAVHIAKMEGQIRAFSAHSANNCGMPWFGPMGTHPCMRGKGIGKILLFRCLNDLKELGYSTAIIPWVGPIDFYSHHAQATVERVFWRYEKKLKSK